MFFWNSLVFYMIQWMLAIWSLVPLPFSKFSLSIWKFLVHVLLKPWLENFEHYFASVWDECSCEVVWTFPDCPVGKESSFNAGDSSSIPGWEDALEKGMATHSSILAWRIPWTVCCKESDTPETLSLSLEYSLALPFFGIGMKTDLF